jgi:putative transposase
VVSPRARRHAAQAACARGLRTRRAAWLCTTARSGIGYEGKRPKRDARLAKALRGVAKRYPQWGYRLAGGFLQQRGWQVNLKRIHRVWRQCGLQVPIRKPRKKVVTGATLQPTAKTKNDVWSWDFVHDVTTAGEPFRCLTVKDEATCFCLAIEVDRSFSHQRVIAVLKRLLVLYGRPRYVRSDNGPELMAQPLLTFFKDQGITPSRITPGKPWQNGSNESFNGTLRRECLDAERFHSLTEAQVVIEDWRRQYNQDRPHSTLNYHSPASAYWGPLSREPETRCLSATAEEKSTHTIDREATIVDHPAPGVGAFETSTSVGRK